MVTRSRRTMQPATVSTTSSSEQEEPLYPDNKPDGNDVADDMSDDEAYRPGRVISWATHVRNANAPPFERPYSPASQMSELSIKPRGTDLQKHRLLMVVLGCAMVANENGAARWDKLYDYIADLKPADMVQAIADTDNRAVITVMIAMLETMEELYRGNKTLRARMTRRDAKYQIKVFTGLDGWRRQNIVAWRAHRQTAVDLPIPCMQPRFWLIHHRLLHSAYGVPGPNELDLSSLPQTVHGEHSRCKLDHFDWAGWGKWWDAYTESRDPYWMRVRRLSLASNSLLHEYHYPQRYDDVQPLDFPRRLLMLCTNLTMLDLSHNPLLFAMPFAPSIQESLYVISRGTHLKASLSDIRGSSADPIDLDSPRLSSSILPAAATNGSPSLVELACRAIGAQSARTGCCAHERDEPWIHPLQAYLRSSYHCERCDRCLDALGCLPVEHASTGDGTPDTKCRPTSHDPGHLETDQAYMDKVLVMHCRYNMSPAGELRVHEWIRVHARVCVPCSNAFKEQGTQYKLVGWRYRERDPNARHSA